MSKECRRCYHDTEEEGYQEEAQKKQVGKKERRTRKVKKEESRTKSLEKKLKACRRRLSMKVLKMKEREQEGPHEAGIARRLKIKKRRKAGKKDQMAEQWEEEQQYLSW